MDTEDRTAWRWQWRQESCGQGCLGRAAGKGQVGQDSRDRTAGLGQGIWERTSGTLQLGQDSETSWTGQDGLTGNLDRTARTGQPGRPGHDNVWKTYISRYSRFWKTYFHEIPDVRENVYDTKNFRHHFRKKVRNIKIISRKFLFVARKKNQFLFKL